MFDEAQRAWDKDKAANFMAQRKGVPNFDQSEPEFLISVMDRHTDWCHDRVPDRWRPRGGEAGLTEWFAALKKRFRHRIPRIHGAPRSTYLSSEGGVFGSLKERNVLPSVAREWRARCRERPLKTTEWCMKKIAIAALGLALSLSMATASWAQGGGAGGGAGGASGGAAAGTGSAGGGVGNSPGASANKSGAGGATTGNKGRTGIGNH
jgi:hypothetical protein